MPTAQEVFDKVVHHLRTQQGQAVEVLDDGDTGVCLYHAPDGKKCAIGVLISDEQYSSGMERAGSVYGLKSGYPDVVRSFTPTDVRTPIAFLIELQAAHDTTSSWTNDKFNYHGESRLAEIAEGYGLTIPPAPPLHSYDAVVEGE